MVRAPEENAFSMSARLVELVTQGLLAAGVEPAGVLAELGLDALDLDDPDVRISYAEGLRLIDAAVAASGDEAFGLHAAGLYRPGSHVVEFLALNSATVGDALRRVCRYYRLLVDAADPSLDIEGDRAIWRVPLRGDLRVPRALAELVVGVAMSAVRVWMGHGVEASEIRFTHPRPADVEPYQDLSGGRLRFGARENAVIFSAAALETPLREANPRLGRILESHAEQLLAEHAVADDFVSQMRAILAAELDGGDPSAVQLARRLGVSPRTLRRRLQRRGTSHHELLEELRRELAERHLRERGLSIDEVAMLLGFSESSTFHRAFKRWTGLTPVEYRRLRMSDPAA